jgi:hypothetical protein
MVEMSRRLTCVAVGALVTLASLPGVARRSDQGPPEPTTPAYDLAAASLETLGLAATARTRLATGGSQGLPQVLQNTRVAVGRLDRARALVREATPTLDPTLQGAARVLESSLDALIAPLRSRVRAMERLLDPDADSSQWRALSAQVTRSNAQLDAAWRQLPAALIQVTQALVDPSRNVDGKLAYMKLKRAEHTAIEAGLNDRFPGAARSPGEHPLDVAVQVLHAFLISGWRAADERAPDTH